MPKEDNFTMSGTVLELLPNATFRVEIAETKHVITAYLGGKLRQHNIKILMGDTVDVEMSSYDLNRGRITYRNK